MNKKFYQSLICGFAISMLGILSLTAQSVLTPKNATVTGMYLPAAPSIDGDLTDDVWVNSTLSGVRYDNTNKRFENLIDKQINTEDNGIVSGTPATGPTTDKYNSEASFGVAWDTNYLYIAVRVYNPNQPFNVPLVAGAPGVELFFSMDNNARSKKTSLAGVWPPKYDNETESQMILSYQGTDKPFLTVNNGVGFNGGGGFSLSNSSFTIATAPLNEGTGKVGYAVEMAIKWRSLNKKWLDPVTEFTYTDATKKPLEGRVMGFDISNNITDAAGARQAQTMWNMCCFNNNYQEGQYFGVLSLAGAIIPPPPIQTIAITPSPASITVANATQKMSVAVTPLGASKQVNWSLIQPAGNPVALIDAAGKVTPLANGTVTVVATSVGQPDKVATSELVITGQTDPTTVVIGGAASINGMWQSSTYTATVTGTGGTPSQLVTWSVSQASGAPLAVINSVTGVLRSTSLGNGTVTVKATSVANGTVFGTKDVTISSKTTIVDACSFKITAFSNFAACRTLGAATIVGHNTSTSLPLRAQYVHPDSATVQPIPDDLMKFEIKTGPIISAKLVKGTTTYNLTNMQGTGVFTVIGTYLNDSTKKSATIIRLLGARPELATVTGCADPLYSKVGCITIGTTDILEDQVLSQSVSVYPNPTEGTFSVSAETLAGGLLNIAVLDVTGSLVYSSSNTVSSGSTSVVIPGAGFKAGLYFVRVGLAGGTPVTKKLVVSK